MPTTTGGPDDWRFERVDGPLESPEQIDWFHALDASPGLHAMRFGSRRKGCYVVRVESGANYEIDAGEWTISAYGLDGVPSMTAIHELCDQVFPLALAAAGDFVLHASAVVRGERVLVFSGPSGSGKSSIAAALVARGWRFFSDDAVRLDFGRDILAWPGYPSVRLWPDSAEAVDLASVVSERVRPDGTKRRYPVVSSGSEPERLGRIYLLEEGDEVSLRIAALPAAMLELARSTFRLDYRDRQAMRLEFGAASQLVAGGGVSVLRFPRRFDALGAVVEALERDQGGDQGPISLAPQSGKAHLK